MQGLEIFWQSYLNLEDEVVKLSKYIYFTDKKFVSSKQENCSSQLEVFSPYIANLIIQCSVEIEAISKELYFELGGEKDRQSKDIYFDEDCINLINRVYGVANKKVYVVSTFFHFFKDENKILRPLKSANKRQGNIWIRAYQGLKHDRYHSLAHGNVKVLINALAALFLLNVYAMNKEWLVDFNSVRNIDFAFGSKVFTLSAPNSKMLWYGNEPIVSDSPYVVRYKDDFYSKLKNIQDKEKEELDTYVSAQPEMHNLEFLRELNEKRKTKPCFPLVEIFKFRLKRECPLSLPFLERKKKLMESEIWREFITTEKQYESQFSREYAIRPDNIDEMVNSISEIYGMRKTAQIQGLKWVSMAMNAKECRVYIPKLEELKTVEANIDSKDQVL